MIVLLSGAKKNIGDFLITHRARTLLEHVLGEPILWMPNWETLDDREDEIAEARAVVVAGGPGYRPAMYGGVYPLFSDPATLPGWASRSAFSASAGRATPATISTSRATASPNARWRSCAPSETRRATRRATTSRPRFSGATASPGS